jgi:hypothetical protein
VVELVVEKQVVAGVVEREGEKKQLQKRGAEGLVFCRL